MRSRAEPVSLESALSQIGSGKTIAVSGFVGAGHPEYLTAGLEALFLKTGTPRDLTLYYVAGQGDRGSRGLNHLAHEGLVRRVFGGHWNLAPQMGDLAHHDKITAYNFPQGVLSVLLREAAAGRPGLLTKVGLHTFVDPRNQGGKMNAVTTEDWVRVMNLPEGEFLFYPTVPLDVALIRATTADDRGNLTVEDEGIIGEILPMAQAAHNNGGIVIAQVARRTHEHSDPKSIRVPGILVDYIVEAPEEAHWQTFGEAFNPDFVRRGGAVPTLAPLPWSERRLIAERVVEELRPGEIVNLGIGLPEGVAAVAAEKGLLSQITLTVESGPTGGIPAGGLSFGCSYSPEVVLDQPSQFDLYDGGGLDLAALGAGEIDALGNVNVSRLGSKIPGAGGFINISQNAHRLVFCTTFTSGGLEVARGPDGTLQILREGKHRKFVRQVQQITFHGPSAVDRGQPVLIVTERAVFSLEPEGLVLIELAPGIDLQTQVLDLMEFAPTVRLQPNS